MKPLFYKLLLLFLAFTGSVLGQKHVVYHKVYDADKNTVLNIDLDKINIAIEESTDGKIHFDYGLEFENYAKKEKQKIIDKIKINTTKEVNRINLKGYSDSEVSRVSYSFDLSHVIIEDPDFFGRMNRKDEKKYIRKSKDSILKEIRYFEETSLKKMLEKFKFKDDSGKIKKVKTKNVKVMKSKFLVRIPPFVKLNIKAKESSVFLNFDYNQKIIIDLEDGKFKSKRLYNLDNTFKITEATLLSESISGQKLDLKNVSKCLIGEISNIDLNSETSKIEIGEVQKNVKIKDFNSELFLYNFSDNFKKFDLISEYTKVHFFHPEDDFSQMVIGNNTVHHFDNLKINMQPNKDGKKIKMMSRDKKGKGKYAGHLDFDIIHGIIYSYDDKFTPNKNN